MVDWKKKTLGKWDLIDKLAKRRFGREVLAEEAALFVLSSLEKDDWKKVSSYSGKSSFTTFILSVSTRLLEDFARKRFGRIRPPLWVKTLGGIWMQLFRSLCVEKLSIREAVETISSRAENISKNEVEEAAMELLGKIVHCGEKTHDTITYDGNEPLSEELTAEDSVAQDQVEEILGAVFQFVVGGKGCDVSEQIKGKFAQLNIALSPKEILLVKLCFQEEMSVTQAGSCLGMTRFQAHGRMRRLLERLHFEFQRVGLEDDLRDQLDITN